MLFPDMMISKSENNGLKFSIRNLIETTTSSYERREKEKANSTANLPLKRIVIESESPSSSSLLSSSIPRPAPLFKPKMPHPCWSFLSQIENRKLNGNIQFNSSLIFLSKMSQIWQQMQRTQILPSIVTKAKSTTENSNVSDDDIYMDMSSSSMHRHNEIDNTDDGDDEIMDNDDEEELEEGECSTSTDDKHHITLNSEENDKLKNYPCTQCGKVKIKYIHLNENFDYNLDIYCTI